MSEIENKKPQERLQERFAYVTEILQRLQALDDEQGFRRDEASEQGQLLAGLRERLSLADVPDVSRGAALSLMLAGMLALAFMGFGGLGA